MHTDKADWIALIEKKMKDGSRYSDLIRHDEHLILEPIQVSREGMLDIPSVSVTPMSIASIDGRDNASILDLLTRGIQALYAVDTISATSHLKGVERAYVDIFFPEAADGCITIDEVIHLSGEIEAYIKGCKDLKQYSQKSVLIKYEPSSDFMLTIAQVRLLRYLLQENDIDGRIIGSIQPVGSAELGAYNLIEVTYKTLSSVIGGCSYLEFDTSDAETFRLHQNILWMLLHEVRIHEVSDPTRGSFLIENITTQLHQRIL